MKLSDYIESTTESLENLYIAAGNRTYVVGSQNGRFPDFGHHMENEMGGVWNHPIKLLDGYWLGISEAATNSAPQHDNELTWLEAAHTFRNFPFYNEHEYRVESLGLCVVRMQFCPDDMEGVVVRYTIKNEGDRARTLNLSFLARTDLLPVWFADNCGIQDGDDEGTFDERSGTFLAKDTLNPWWVAVAGNLPVTSAVVDKNLFGPEKTAGKGVTCQLNYANVELPAHGTVDVSFFVAGSTQSKEAVVATLSQLKAHHAKLFDAKRERYEQMLMDTNINIPDKELQKVFNWVKFNTDWLVRETAEVGRGLGAGHPEYSWWFGCDNSYALKGVLGLGNLALATDTLNLLAKVSNEANHGNGKIVHEFNTFGHVANRGNTQETPHFIACVWDTFLWTGDIHFLRNLYPMMKKGITWLLEEMDSDGDLLPEGYGIIEIEGLNLELIDTAVYTYEALRVGALAATLFEEPVVAAKYHALADQLASRINNELWLDDEGLYADAVGPTDLILGRMDTYIERARTNGEEKAAQELEQMKQAWEGADRTGDRPWLFKNWVINTPMEIGLAPREKAIRALDRMATDEFTGPWGTYLSGLYRSHMMSITSGVQAVAEARYDRMDEALRYINLIVSTFNKNTPGSISEMSPDYGCFVQAWTAYGMVWPLITQMFGVQPNAYLREVTIRPRLPKAWNEASVKWVRMGSADKANVVSLAVQLGDAADVYRIDSEKADWRIRLDLPSERRSSDGSFTVYVNGMAVESYTNQESLVVELTGHTQYVVEVRP